MKKLILSIPLLIVSILFNYGQQPITNDPLKIPDYIPSSPEVAGFAKYGDIPVSEYTGTANISIPIHIVKSGKLSLPIDLSYHPSGIQVSQEATWVGLGWNLIAGGAITYSQVGGNEQVNYNATMLPWEDRESLLNYVTDGLDRAGFKHEVVNYLTNPPRVDCLSGPTPCRLIELLTLVPTHGEPDVYNVNFLSYSFKFFIHPKDNSIIFIGKKNNKCKVDQIGNIFIITGEDGVKYFFSSLERDSNGNSIIAWYLTKIMGVDGSVIKLNYQNFGSLNSIPSLSERMSSTWPLVPFSYDRIKRSINALGHQTYNQYLSSIETDNEKVIFDVDAREDILGTGARKLKAIRVRDSINHKEIVNYSLVYGYFIGSDIGGDYSTDDNYKGFAVTDDALRKRLKLTKLTQNDPASTSTKGQEYTFDYDESVPLPLKTSFARDFWGYYNGQENSSDLIPNGAKHTLIPDLYSLTLQGSLYDGMPEELKRYTGANRGTSTANITACMLKSITYPTGGKTLFQFEPHTFSNQNYISAEDRNKFFSPQSYHVWYNNSVASHTNETFTVNKRALIHFTGTIHGNGGGTPFTLNQLLDAYIAISSTTGPSVITYRLSAIADDPSFAQNGYRKTWTEDFYLEPGTYILACGFPSSLNYQGTVSLVSADISYNNYNASVLVNAKPIGGGVRIKTIANYDSNNSLLSTKNYTYLGGSMLTPLQMLENRFVHGLTNGNIYTISSDSYNPPASAYCGTNVGYDQVEITMQSGSNTNGKEIVFLQNTPGTQIFAMRNIYDYSCTNGDILKQVYLSSTNDTVRVEKMTYAEGDLYSEPINFILEDNFLFDGAEPCEPGTGCRYNFFVYLNKGLWSYLKSKVTTDYLNGNKVTQTTEFNYNSKNYCVSEQKQTSSDNKVKSTQFKYPVDYGAEPLYTMANDLNIINPVIEQSDYVGTNFLQSTSTSYSPWGTNVLGYPLYKPSDVSTKANSTSNDEIRVWFDDYDNLGNVLQYHKTNDVNTSFIWGYNKTYPVAKIENATLDEVKTALGGSIPDLGIEGLSTTQVNELRTNLPKSFVTTYTYIPLIGIATQTDPNGVTTYYEYDTFGRLKLVRDKDQKILKQYQYHYQCQ